MVAVYSLDIHNTSTASWATQLCSVFIESLLPTVLSHRDCEVVCVVSDGVNPAAFQNRLYWFFQQVQTVTAEIRTLLLLWSSEPSASDNWIYLFWQYKYMQLSFHVGLMGSVRSMSSLSATEINKLGRWLQFYLSSISEVFSTMCFMYSEYFVCLFPVLFPAVV